MQNLACMIARWYLRAISMRFRIFPPGNFLLASEAMQVYGSILVVISLNHLVTSQRSIGIWGTQATEFKSDLRCDL